MSERGAVAWRSQLSDGLTRAADLVLAAEPFWVIGAVAFTCATLLWGLGWSWVGLLVAFASFPLRRWRLGYLTRRTPFDIPVALLPVASLVGLSVSPDRGLSLGALQSVLACILLYYSLVNVVHPEQIKWGFAIAAACVFVAALLAFREGFMPPTAVGGLGNWVREQLQHLPGAPRASGIINPTLSSAHGLAIVLAIVLIPLGGLVLFSRRAWRGAVAGLACLPFVVLLLLFGSQAAWLAVGAGVAVLLVWRSRWAVLPLAVVVGVGYLGYRQGWLDPESFFSPFSPAEGLRARVELWKSALGVIGDHPVAGCGLGYLGKYSTTSLLSPHSAYLQFYADMGLVGAVALLWAVVAGGRMAYDLVRARRVYPWYGFAVGLTAAGVVVVVHGIFEGALAGVIAETADGYYYIVSPVVAILAGLLVVTTRLVQASTPEAPPRVP